MLHVKGLGVLDCRTYITERFGEAAHEKIRAEMTERDQDIVYAEDLSPLSWVEVEAVINHALAVDRALGNGDGEVRDTMLRELARKHFHGIYRIMFRSVSRGEVVAKLGSIWSRYYDHGQGTIEFLDECHATNKITGVADAPLHHELLVIPYIESILTLCGLKTVAVKHTRCVARGDDSCVFQYSWT